MYFSIVFFMFCLANANSNGSSTSGAIANYGELNIISYKYYDTLIATNTYALRDDSLVPRLPDLSTLKNWDGPGDEASAMMHSHVI